MPRITRASERAAGELSRPPARLPVKPAPPAHPTQPAGSEPAPDGYANTPWQLISKAMDDRRKTLRLISISVSIILACCAGVCGGIALIILTLHGIHLPHKYLLPVGLGTGATSVIAVIIGVLSRVLGRAPEPK
jgi:hypothetical protein